MGAGADPLARGGGGRWLVVEQMLGCAADPSAQMWGVADLGAKAPRSRPPAWAPGRDGSELVRIFLWEWDEQAAWETATEGGCSDTLWLELATRRRRTKPEDALRVYERQVEATIAGRSNDAYREAVALMEEVRSVLEQMGDWEAFPRYVERVREAHRRKRNLMKLLDAIA